MARGKGFEYGSLLKRARDGLPAELSSESRWSVPEVEVLHEGRTTIIRNWRDILDTLRRDKEHVLSYLLREVGTAGDGDDERVVFMGKIQTNVVQEKLQNYVDTYVMCEECHRPDTHLTKDGRITLLKCDACGAHKPVKAKKRRGGDTATAIAEGKIVEIQVTDVNEKGVPFGVHDGLKVFVPGAQKGKTVRVRIDRLVGQSAVAKLVE
jgi:translation initiation factor 2 subunit 2